MKFTFLDDGNGIPNDIKNKIFNKGFSTKGTKLERGSGMSINKSIIESAGGYIKYIPTENGACFELKIPVIKVGGDK